MVWYHDLVLVAVAILTIVPVFPLLQCFATDSSLAALGLHDARAHGAVFGPRPPASTVHPFGQPHLIVQGPRITAPQHDASSARQKLGVVEEAVQSSSLVLR